MLLKAYKSLKVNFVKVYCYKQGYIGGSKTVILCSQHIQGRRKIFNLWVPNTRADLGFLEGGTS